MRWIGSVSTAMLVSVVAGGCSAQGDAAGKGLLPTVTDSAGVEIVVNRVPPTGLPVYATLDSARDLDLGFVLGDETSHLLDVEGVVTLSNGEVAVANGSTLQVRYYGPDGTALGWVGGPGMGDGEYRDLSRLGRAGGDTLWAADHARHRLTVFEKEAGFLSVHELPSGYAVAGRFGDGSYLLVPGWPRSLHEQDPVEGVRRDPSTYVRWWPSGDTVAVGAFPHDQIMVVETDQRMSAGVPPFGRQTVQAVGPGRFYVGDQEGFVIGGYDPDGTLRQSIRLEGLDLTLSPEQISAARAKRGALWGGPEHADRIWATVPDTRPAYGRMLLDAGGNLWVAEHAPTADSPVNWTVLSPDGTVRGIVMVPRFFTPREIGLRYVLGVLRTTGGDERVVRYRLHRGS